MHGWLSEGVVHIVERQSERSLALACSLLRVRPSKPFARQLVNAIGLRAVLMLCRGEIFGSGNMMDFFNACRKNPSLND